MEKTWYKNSILYSLDVETFYDSNNDGIGDFNGLTSKLGYLSSLGITCVWLLPFYPSPNRDNGYDVMDYYSVDPKLGNLGDFSEFMRLAEQYGIRVLIDLVVNHTSVHHPWFQQARKDKNSPYRDYYVWANEPLSPEDIHLIFEGEEESVWTFDETAGQYYLHRFYKEQPDLNISNPNVRNEIQKIMGFWLQLGVSGFRIDAAEILIESYGLENTEARDMDKILVEMRTFIESHKSDAILLAEANVNPDQMHTYLRESERMHLLFNFYINQHLFLSVADQTAKSLADALNTLPKEYSTDHWLNFLRHHDELSLKLLTAQEREKVFKQFAPEQKMRIFGRGIRRRLAPMLNGNEKLMKLMYSILFSLPGGPMIRYGEEIAMGENLLLEGRASVRTPMQWHNGLNGGFSNAASEKLSYPMLTGKYGPRHINVLNAQKNPDSFLNWLKRLIDIRKQCPEILSGSLAEVKVIDKVLLFHSFSSEDGKLILIHNLSNHPVSLNRKNIMQDDEDFCEIFSDNLKKQLRQKIQINGYGFKWLQSLK